jgi:hypothetical protein
MIPNARFTELLTDIEPSSTTKANASSGHNAVRDHLRTHEDFEDRWEGSFLSGSYVRDTSIRPKTTDGQPERPDVDIIIVTNYQATDTPNKVLNELSRALEAGDDGFKVERINKRSVRIITWQAEMDIVPVIVSGNGYKIADRDTGGWTFTNPPQHTKWSSDQNTAFSGRFKPLVKLLKWWRRENPTNRRPKGFVLEVLTALHAPKNEAHYGEAFAKLLENIHAAYAWMASTNQKPFIQDPAFPSNDILAKVTLNQWKEFLEKVRVYAEYARKAQNTDDAEEATRHWRRVFGDRFKSTANVAKAASYGGFATATAATGYTFPNAMAAPSKPRGFA